MARLRCWGAVALQVACLGTPALATEAPIRAGAYLQTAVSGPIDGYLGLSRIPSGNPLHAGLSHAQILLDGSPLPLSEFKLRVDAANPAAIALTEGYLEVGPEWARLALGRMRAVLNAETLLEDWELQAFARSEPEFSSAPEFASSPYSTLPGDFVDSARATVRIGAATAFVWGSASDLATRLELRTGPALVLGSYYLASDPLLPLPTLAVDGGGSRPAFRDRWGADVTWREGPFSLAGEFRRGFETTAQGGLFGQGLLAQATLDLPAEQQILLRFEMADLDGGTPVPSPVLWRTGSATLGWSLRLPAAGAKIRLQVRRDQGSSDSALAGLEIKI